MAENEITQEVTLEEKQSPALPKKSTPLVFGILSLVLSCDISILGIIFGFVARKKSKPFFETGNKVPAPVKVGRILGTVGAILSIVMTVLGVLTIIGMIIALVAIMSDPEVANAISNFFTEGMKLSDPEVIEAIENFFKETFNITLHLA